jgi:hypothetical protein
MPKINPVLDGRALTNWSPACEVDSKLMTQLNVNNTRDFKIALMNQGTQIMANDNTNISSTLKTLAYDPKW